MFSPLVKGSGTWDGRLEVIEDELNEPSFDALLPSISITSNHEKSKLYQKVSPIPDNDHFERIELPKTFLTRKGAIVLFSSPKEHRYQYERHQHVGKQNCEHCGHSDKHENDLQFIQQATKTKDGEPQQEQVCDTRRKMFMNFLQELVEKKRNEKDSSKNANNKNVLNQKRLPSFDQNESTVHQTLPSRPKTIASLFHRHSPTSSTKYKRPKTVPVIPPEPEQPKAHPRITSAKPRPPTRALGKLHFKNDPSEFEEGTMSRFDENIDIPHPCSPDIQQDGNSQKYTTTNMNGTEMLTTSSYSPTNLVERGLSRASSASRYSSWWVVDDVSLSHYGNNLPDLSTTSVTDTSVCPEIMECFTRDRSSLDMYNVDSVSRPVSSICGSSWELCSEAGVSIVNRTETSFSDYKDDNISKMSFHDHADTSRPVSSLYTPGTCNDGISQTIYHPDTEINLSPSYGRSRPSTRNSVYDTTQDDVVLNGNNELDQNIYPSSTSPSNKENVEYLRQNKAGNNCRVKSAPLSTRNTSSRKFFSARSHSAVSRTRRHADHLEITNITPAPPPTPPVCHEVRIPSTSATDYDDLNKREIDDTNEDNDDFQSIPNNDISNQQQPLQPFVKPNSPNNKDIFESSFSTQEKDDDGVLQQDIITTSSEGSVDKETVESLSRPSNVDSEMNKQSILSLKIVDNATVLIPNVTMNNRSLQLAKGVDIEESGEPLSRPESVCDSEIVKAVSVENVNNNENMEFVFSKDDVFVEGSNVHESTPDIVSHGSSTEHSTEVDISEIPRKENDTPGSRLGKMLDNEGVECLVEQDFNETVCEEPDNSRAESRLENENERECFQILPETNSKEILPDINTETPDIDSVQIVHDTISQVLLMSNPDAHHDPTFENPENYTNLKDLSENHNTSQDYVNDMKNTPSPFKSEILEIGVEKSDDSVNLSEGSSSTNFGENLKPNYMKPNEDSSFNYLKTDTSSVSSSSNLNARSSSSSRKINENFDSISVKPDRNSLTSSVGPEENSKSNSTKFDEKSSSGFMKLVENITSNSGKSNGNSKKSGNLISDMKRKETVIKTGKVEVDGENLDVQGFGKAEIKDNKETGKVDVVVKNKIDLSVFVNNKNDTLKKKSSTKKSSKRTREKNVREEVEPALDVITAVDENLIKVLENPDGVLELSEEALNQFAPIENFEDPELLTLPEEKTKDAYSPSKVKKSSRKGKGKKKNSKLLEKNNEGEERKKTIAEEKQRQKEELKLLKEREEEQKRLLDEVKEKQRTIQEEREKRLEQESQARLLEQEAEAQLKETKRKTKEEREKRREEEAERRRQDVQRKREEKRKRELEMQKREQELEKQRFNREERMAELQARKEREKELERMAEEQRKEEERLRLLALEEERKLEEETIKEAEEELHRLAREREYREQMRKIAENQQAKLEKLETERRLKEQEERRVIEEERRRLEEEQLARENEERERVRQLRQQEAIARIRAAHEASKRRAWALRQRERNIDRMAHLKYTRQSQKITEAFTFSYHVHIPRKVWELPYNWNEKKKVRSPRRKKKENNIK